MSKDFKTRIVCGYAFMACAWALAWLLGGLFYWDGEVPMEIRIITFAPIGVLALLALAAVFWFGASEFYHGIQEVRAADE